MRYKAYSESHAATRHACTCLPASSSLGVAQNAPPVEKQGHKFGALVFRNRVGKEKNRRDTEWGQINKKSHKWEGANGIALNLGLFGFSAVCCYVTLITFNLQLEYGASVSLQKNLAVFVPMLNNCSPGKP